MKKKIALVGNMNNGFFAITRHLRDAGYDAQLFYSELQDHFEPKSDTFDLNYTKFCFQVDWLRNGYFLVDIDLVKRDLQNFDIFIGQGDDAAVASMAGIQFDIYFPYGSDFYKYAWLPQNFRLSQRIFMKILKKIPFSKTSNGTLAKFTRKAIVEAKNVLLDFTNEEYEARLIALGLKGNYLNIPMPFIYPKSYKNCSNWDTHWKSIIDVIRANNDLIILYHGRQQWKSTYSHSDFTNKNTHHLIYGFNEFLKKNLKINCQLLMIEYGNDILASKGLIQELQIESRVTWLPKMYRKDLMYIIQNSDLCCGEFNRSYLTFGTIVEAMSLGKPVLHYRVDSLYSENYDSLYPMYNCRLPLEICHQIQEAYDHPEERKIKGQQAKVWVENYFINRPLEIIKQIINE